MKLCKDCAHRRGLWWFEPKCAHPHNREINPVTGRWQYRYYNYCSIQRIGTSDATNCGSEGSWWEQRPQLPESRFIRIFRKT